MKQRHTHIYEGLAVKFKIGFGLLKMLFLKVV